ncbi:DUF192 domain-containing protein [Rhodanobacter sp. 115]|uniref:DUF192 domain-containing protein n=1 Tax=Rhodanobacter sp. FW021-MT20 TaxID=1162282 RepID=UPI0034E3D451
MQVIEATVGNPVDVRLRISVAATLFERIRGLLGRPSPKRGEGLLIRKCKTVHTIGMAYPIDVVYLDRDWCVVGVAHSVRPGCVRAPTPPRRSGVVQVLELADREAAWIGLMPGSRLRTTFGESSSANNDTWSRA